MERDSLPGREGTSDFGLRTSDFGLQTLSFRFQISDFENVSLSICVCTLYTNNCNRELDYILRDYFLFRDILISRFLPSRLQTSDFRLQTSDFRLRTSDFGLQTSDFGLQNSDFRLRTSDFRRKIPISEFCPAYNFITIFNQINF